MYHTSHTNNYMCTVAAWAEEGVVQLMMAVTMSSYYPHKNKPCTIANFVMNKLHIQILGLIFLTVIITINCLTCTALFYWQAQHIGNTECSWLFHFVTAAWIFPWKSPCNYKLCRHCSISHAWWYQQQTCSVGNSYALTKLYMWVISVKLVDLF